MDLSRVPAELRAEPRWVCWRASGIGFVFAPDRAYTGLDLDHVLSGGVLADAYRWVVSEARAYCEVSPSGDGLHLIFRRPKTEGATRCRRGCVEMYDHDRFFTVTGNVFEGHSGLGENPRVVERAYRTWIDPSPVTAGRQTTMPESDRASGASLPDDAELVRRMRASRNGTAIGALLDGDMAAYGGDHSAADLAL